jgi:hypothetical protein
MSVRNAVLAIALMALAGRAAADIPDGKGGRTSPQASKSQVAAAVQRCCEERVRAALEPKVPPRCESPCCNHAS